MLAVSVQDGTTGKSIRGRDPRVYSANDLFPQAHCATSSYSSLLHGKFEFHAEWLRDEPCDATATGSGSYIQTARGQLPPGNGEHEIRMRALFLFAFRPLFPFSWKKRPLYFRRFLPARPQLFAAE